LVLVVGDGTLLRAREPSRFGGRQGRSPRTEGLVANKDKGGKSDKKQPQKNLKEKRAAKKQKKK
jgi:hypothetical protein